MHILQPKHTRLNEKEASEILQKLNISKSQLPKIFKDDSALPEDCQIGDLIQIERKNPETGEVHFYYRVVI
jgi:DNA-directed RNA polymerase subunit H